MEALVVVLFIVGALLLAYLGYEARQRRIRALAAVAASLGLEFRTDDPFALDDKPFALFSKGDGRGCENVMWGRLHDRDVIAFEYWYYVTHHNPKGGSSRQYYRFTCAITDSMLNAPHLTIGPEGLLTRFADVIGFRDIQFESGEFNDRIQVKGDDEKFANYLIDARMMEWLLAAHGWSFEVHGAEILSSSERLSPEDFSSVVDALVGFTAHVPRAALDVYGRT